ncbi:MAG TPA: L,D-transpeptidase family protein [Steroidobacteraceae bacterium]|jgi:murein L,D-transpeptidase YcbB/YkuD|nr:L,D-transpeptidase family protein [Steroidobacteraceae bacterium]
MNFARFVLVGLLAANDASAVDALLWTHGGNLTSSATAVLAEMRDAGKYGLLARDYDADALIARAAAIAQNPGADRAQALDSDISRAVARFVTHLHSGRVSPRAVGHDLDVPHAALDSAVAVRALAQSQAPLAVLADYEPAFHHYELLRAALMRYRTLAAQGDGTPLPPSGKASVKPGEAYAGMAALRARLVQLGDLEKSALDSQSGELLDAVTSMALVRFQVRHRLEVDGALGRATIDALNVPLTRRVRQIEFALERSRWLPSRLASPPIIVNIPQFELFAFRTTEDREADILIMDVVVGKVFPQNNTPVFVSDMKQVVLRPYWDVPRSIVLGELLPKIKANPNWVDSNDFEIVRGQGDDGTVVPQSEASVAALEAGSLRLRQKPGPRNALGNAKFLFPNRYNVYLHDTPSQGAFAQASRAASHGCVRVIDPPALARHVLRNNPEWPAARIDAAMNAATGTRINLAQPIRVFLIYATALALEDGRVLFFEDIYHHDEKLAKVW